MQSLEKSLSFVSTHLDGQKDSLQPRNEQDSDLLVFETDLVDVAYARVLPRTAAR